MTPKNFEQLVLPHLQDDPLCVIALAGTGVFFHKALPNTLLQDSIAKTHTFLQPKPPTLNDLATFVQKSEDAPTTIKAVMVGHTVSGKTLLRNKYTSAGTDNLLTRPTIGIEFSSKWLQFGSKSLQFQIWDTAGSERYRQITKTAFTGAKIIYHVCDMQNRDTYHALETWLEQSRPHREKTPDSVGIILIKNKQLCTKEEMRNLQRLAVKYDIAAYHGVDDTPMQIEKAFHVGLRYHLARVYKNSPTEQQVRQVSQSIIQKLQSYQRLRLIAHGKRTEALMLALRKTTELHQISTLLKSEIDHFDGPKRERGTAFSSLKFGLQNRIKCPWGYYGKLKAAQEQVEACSTPLALKA